MRDDFLQIVKNELAKRAGHRCSICRQSTSGPQSEATGSVNIGAAGHITAASAGGPRYDPTLTNAQRRSASNGIWLCQNHGKLVDNDLSEYTKEELLELKAIAEATAFLELKGRRVIPDTRLLIEQVAKDIPDLITEMRNDIHDNPLCREFILLSRKWRYNDDPNKIVLRYYFEDHADLRNKVRLLENKRLINEVAFNTIDRFLMSEELVDYLRRS